MRTGHLKTTWSAVQSRTKGKAADKAIEWKSVLKPVISYVPAQLSCSLRLLFVRNPLSPFFSVLNPAYNNIDIYLYSSGHCVPLLLLSLFLLFIFPSLLFFSPILTLITVTVPKAQRLPWCMVPGCTSFPSLLQTYRKENDFIQKANKINTFKTTGKSLSDIIGYPIKSSVLGLG